MTDSEFGGSHLLVVCAPFYNMGPSNWDVSSDAPFQLMTTVLLLGSAIDGRPGYQVSVAFDDEPFQEVNWSAPLPHRSGGAFDDIVPMDEAANEDFLRQAQDARMVTFRFIVDNGSEFHFRTFDLEALFNTPIQPYLDTCGQTEPPA